MTFFIRKSKKQMMREDENLKTKKIFKGSLIMFLKNI